jgi:hypothetical protein
LDLEGNRDVGLSRKQQEPVVFIRSFHLLFEGRHEPVLGLDGGVDLRIFYFEEYLFLPLFRDLLLESVDGLADLDGPEFGRSGLLHWLDGGVPGLACGSAGEVGLVLLAVRVRQVAALVGVQRQTEAALVCADVVAHEVGVFGDVDGLQRQLPQPLPSLHVGVLVAGHAHVADPRPRTVLPVNHI